VGHLASRTNFAAVLAQPTTGVDLEVATLIFGEFLRKKRTILTPDKSRLFIDLNITF
jgi:hypothetical protein